MKKYFVNFLLLDTVCGQCCVHISIAWLPIPYYMYFSDSHPLVIEHALMGDFGLYAESSLWLSFELPDSNFQLLYVGYVNPFSCPRFTDSHNF